MGYNSVVHALSPFSFVPASILEWTQGQVLLPNLLLVFCHSRCQSPGSRTSNSEAPAASAPPTSQLGVLCLSLVPGVIVFFFQVQLFVFVFFNTSTYK